MAYNKKFDVMKIDELIEILVNQTDDYEYELARTKSPKKKRQFTNILEYSNSLLGILQKQKSNS